ncbi:MAG: hypothetical protein ACJASM_002980 [Salibacteraceae bacterium]
MENKQFIIELIRYGAWPVVAGAAIFFLKDKISNLFGGGLKSAKHGDTEFQFFEGKQSFKPKNPEQQNLQHLIPIDPTGLREDVEGRINEQLAQVTGDNEKIGILVKNLAQQQISNAFEKVYYNIFGSQIRLLEFLSVQAEGKAPVQVITPYFERAKHEDPEIFERHQFSDYMNFLLSWNLVENNNGEWLITKHGRAFITYITAVQLDKNKAL